MKYAKPALSALGSSAWAVRGSVSKLLVLLFDQSGAFYVVTQPAYEADE